MTDIARSHAELGAALILAGKGTVIPKLRDFAIQSRNSPALLGRVVGDLPALDV